MAARLRSVQVLRGAAACGVVFLHAFSTAHPVTDSYARLGAAGVDLFFVISGFIIATIPKRSAGEFLFDRAWRIFPIWLIAAIPCLLWARAGLTTIAATLTLWPIYGQFTLPVLPVGWTLSFELLFYLGAALALLTRPALPLLIFAGGLVAGALLRWPIFDLIGNPMIFDFLFGLAIARAPKRAMWGAPAILLALALLAISPLQIYLAETAISAATAMHRVVFWGIPAALLVYGALCLETRLGRAAGVPVLLGDASYSIYLFHIPVVQLAHLPWPVEFVLAVTVGVAVYWALERPIQRARRRIKVHLRPSWLGAVLPAGAVRHIPRTL